VKLNRKRRAEIGAPFFFVLWAKKKAGLATGLFRFRFEPAA
jgi:hypothetical protein